MAYASLLFATKKLLIENLTYANRPLNEGLCDVMVDGRPPTNAGEIFVAIHAGGFRGLSTEILECSHSLNVTLTFRCAKTGFDRVGMKNIVDQSLGMGDFAQLIVEYIHLNYQILHDANERIVKTKNRWVEPLRFANSSPPRYVDGNWFHAKEGQEEALVQTIAFSEAKRVQFAAFQPYPEDFDGIEGGGALEHDFRLPEHLIKDVLFPYDLP